FAPAQLGDAVLAAQTGQNNADLLLRRKLAPGDAADLLYNLLSRFLHRPGFLSHLRSFNGYDGPEILPSSTRPFCLIGADAGHYWLMLTVRDAIPKAHALATAEFATIRLRLLKLGARGIEMASRVPLAFAAA